MAAPIAGRTLFVKGVRGGTGFLLAGHCEPECQLWVERESVRSASGPIYRLASGTGSSGQEPDQLQWSTLRRLLLARP